jgi:hypothetical protein
MANDSYGGQVAQETKEKKSKRGLLRRVFGSMNSGAYGYGGRTSSAYMLQYIRRSDIPLLYDEDKR